MGKQRYERLSAQDVSFLVMENANVHMHVGAINICAAAAAVERASAARQCPVAATGAGRKCCRRRPRFPLP